MAARRILVALIGLLSGFIILAGGGLAALAYWRLWAPPGGQELLVVGDDRSLTLLGRSGPGHTVAEDVSPDLFRYPSPAPDGRRIAYIGRDANGTALHSLDLRTGERTELYRSVTNPPLYAAWSPDGRNISFLSNQGSGGLAVYIVPADGSGEADRVGAAASSSYFAWRPDGSALLIHAGGGPGSLGTVAAYEPGNPRPLSQIDDPGFFQAPAWSVDGRAFYYVAQPAVSGALTPDNVESVLTRVASDGSDRQVIVSEKRAAMIFSRAPGSDHLAYITITPDGFGALKVVGGAGGEARTLSRPDEQVAAFFWAPEGDRIAYLTFEGGRGPPPRLTWHLIDREGGEVRDLASFTPSQAFAAMVSFFDAYAVSLSVWSPDGKAIAYASDDGVYDLDVASGEPRRRADGVLGLWVRR